VVERSDLTPLERVRRNYKPAFLSHLAGRDERSLRSAYEIGREAMANNISMLDLVHVHHTVFLEVAATVRDVGEVSDLTDAATAFLLESLAPYEMTRQQPSAAQGPSDVAG
jgi:Phosphoserine phosphatase RsbU, N-terminal domain